MACRSSELLSKHVERILDALPEGVFISDAAGTSLRVNRMYEQLTGLTQEQLRGKNVRDLVQDGDGWRSSCVVDAVRADGSALLDDHEVLNAPQASVANGIPVTLLWAPRGALNQPMGLYGGAWPPWLPLPKGITAERVADTNHYTVIFDPAAVRLVSHRLLDISGLR